MEIEKKFLLEQIPFDLSPYPVLIITQSYISTSPTIRLRRQNDEYILTVKGEGHMAREEFELPLTALEYAHLSQKAESGTVNKRRYLIPLPDGLTAELDVYEGSLSGLLTVEVEFESLEMLHSFVPPNWFGQDVTNEKRYKNSSLSIHGLPK